MAVTLLYATRRRRRDGEGHGSDGADVNPTPNEEPKEPAVSICDIRGKAASQRGLWQKARLLSTFIGALFPGALVILPAQVGGRVLTTSGPQAEEASTIAVAHTGQHVAISLRQSVGQRMPLLSVC